MSEYNVLQIIFYRYFKKAKKVDCTRGLDQASSNDWKHLVFPDFPDMLYKPIKCNWKIAASPATYIQATIEKNSKFHLSLRFLTSSDLVTTLFEKLTSSASFWYIKSLPYEKLESWSKRTRNLKFDIRPEIFVQIFSFVSLITFSYNLGKFDQSMIFNQIFLKGVGGTNIA